MIHKYNKDFRCNKPSMDFILNLRRSRVKGDVDIEALSRGRVMELIMQYFAKYKEDYQKILKMEYKA